MIDFKLDSSGDIVLEKDEPIKKIKVGMGFSEFPILKATFRQRKKYDEEAEMLQTSDMRAKISFKKNTTDSNKIKNIYDEEAIRQRIMILFRTKKGIIEQRPEFGSEINYLRHEDRTVKGFTTELEDLMANELKDILEQPNVAVRHVKADGPFSCQTLTAYIYDGTKPVTDLVLEEI